MRQSCHALQLVHLVVLCACAVPLAGCGGPTAEDYVPEADVARQGLEAALASWKNGEPLKTITSLSVPVNVVDERWRAGQKLQSFEIISEAPGDPHRTFTVKLRISGKDQDEETKYVVTGRDPILVFREEDYNVGGM
jgi:hypothetical protein